MVAPGDDRDHAELGSAEDVRLERLLEDLHATAMTLALSLKAVSRRPDNPVYRASAEQQAQVGREQVLEVLCFEAVAHSDEAAAEAVRGIEAFLELAEQFGAERARAQVTELFQRFLGRNPTPDELSAFLKILDEPGTTWRTAALALLTSPHYQYY